MRDPKLRAAGFVEESQNGGHVKFVKREDAVIIRWEIEEDGQFGPISRETEERLDRRISALKRERDFKIGITNDPERRAGEYDRDGGEYHDMVVLYRGGTFDRVRSLERTLVGKHLNREGSDNKQEGGSGPVGEKRTGYYLYIVRSRTRRARRWGPNTMRF